MLPKVARVVVVSLVQLMQNDLIVQKCVSVELNYVTGTLKVNYNKRYRSQGMDQSLAYVVPGQKITV